MKADERRSTWSCRYNRTVSTLQNHREVKHFTVYQCIPVILLSVMHVIMLVVKGG